MRVGMWIINPRRIIIFAFLPVPIIQLILVRCYRVFEYNASLCRNLKESDRISAFIAWPEGIMLKNLSHLIELMTLTSL